MLMHFGALTAHELFPCGLDYFECQVMLLSHVGALSRQVNTVFAADAMYRLTGVPGVAVITAGPGVTNTITAVKNAQMAESAVIVLGVRHKAITILTFCDKLRVCSFTLSQSEVSGKKAQYSENSCLCVA